MKRFISQIVRSGSPILVFSVLALTSCGGGGGGGGGDAVGGDRFGVRVLHSGLEISPAEYTDPNDETVLHQVRFLGANVYRMFPEGPHTVSLFRQNSGGSRFISSLSFSVEPETRYTVLLYGDQTELGPRSSVFTDNVPELSEGEAAVRFIHGVDGATAISIGDLTVSFGSASAYEKVASGEFSFTVTRSADGQVITSGTLTLEDKRSYSILVGGEVDVYVGTQLSADG
ncbi:MAG: DUF4397 domain-containing protein [Bdellovibrionales bacterium]|nr:DUF4397 domain-containing protein [Bdellovibrionales bacterium]